MISLACFHFAINCMMAQHHSHQKILQHLSENVIDRFVEKYRTLFPSATFIPKLHMMEDHIIPWIKSWKIGCGIMVEQGAESLHAAFNTSERAYNNMTDRVERMKVLLKNHLLQIQPANTSLEPPLLKKRKRNTEL
jgi:hypothetical protein